MSFLEKLLNTLMGYRVLVKETMDDVQQRVEVTTKRVLKTSALFVLLMIAVLFVLVGLAQAAQTHYGWLEGTGYIVVGAVLTLLVMLINAMK